MCESHETRKALGFDNARSRRQGVTWRLSPTPLMSTMLSRILDVQYRAFQDFMWHNRFDVVVHDIGADSTMIITGIKDCRAFETISKEGFGKLVSRITFITETGEVLFLSNDPPTKRLVDILKTDTAAVPARGYSVRAVFA